MNDSRKILFVGGIPAIMTEDEIERHFSRFCRVSKVRIMREKKTLEPKGFAFVTLADSDQVSKVLSMIHVIEGRKVDVQLASRKGEKKEWKEELKKKRIFISNLPNNFTNEELYQHFSKYGEVRNAYIIKDFMTDQSKNYGYIEFSEVGIVHSVLKEQVTIHGHKVVCLPYLGRHEPRNSKVKGGKDDGEASSEIIYRKKETSDAFTTGNIPERFAQQPPQTNRAFRDSTNNSKYEFIGLSRKLNQDESNYCFTVARKVGSIPGHRLPVVPSDQVTFEKTGAVSSKSIARYIMLKNSVAKKNIVSLETQESVSRCGDLFNPIFGSNRQSMIGVKSSKSGKIQPR